MVQGRGLRPPTLHPGTPNAAAKREESYTRIGVVSNGYVVVGGGTAADVSFINQSLPNPAAPNDVLAPFWTDLDLTSARGGALRVATLTDGVSTWLVVDWDKASNYSA
jgi:hypothetical protein